MAGPLSCDLRERVVTAVLAGESCSAVWCFGAFGHQVEPAIPRHRLGGSRQDGWASPADPGWAARFYPGADSPGPAPDAAWPQARVGRARRDGVAQCGLAVFEA